MTSEGDPGRGYLNGDKIDWQAIHRHLNVGAYEHVAEILLEAQLVWEQTKETALVQLLATACRICLACSASRAEVDWHRRARQEADQRECDLRQQLFTILELIGELETSGTTVEPERRSDLLPLETPLLEQGTQPDAEQPSLWRRIQTFFGLGAIPPAPEPQPSRPSYDAEALRIGDAGAVAESPAAGKELLLRAETASSTREEVSVAPQPSAVGPVPSVEPAVPENDVELTNLLVEDVGRPRDPHPVLADALPLAADAAPAPEPPEVGAAQSLDPHPVLLYTPAPSGDAGGAETPLAEELAEPVAAHPDQGTVPSLDAKKIPSSPAQQVADSPLTQPVPSVPPTASLIVYCLGPFRVYQDDQLVEEWPSSKGRSIFKYLVTHRERPVPKEVLMELFWPESDPDAARNNLNVAIYGLRQALRKARPSFSHVLFQDDFYLLNPELALWLDLEAFRQRLASAKALEESGAMMAAVEEYISAEALYQGEFLEEDRYEDWVIPLRERLHRRYLDLLERVSRHYFDQEDIAACTTICRKMLTVDPCREEAHRRLMRCYIRQGQPYLAVRQYYSCVEALKAELDVPPTAATTQLYKRIRRREPDESV